MRKPVFKVKQDPDLSWFFYCGLLFISIMLQSWDAVMIVALFITFNSILSIIDFAAIEHSLRASSGKHKTIVLPPKSIQRPPHIIYMDQDDIHCN